MNHTIRQISHFHRPSSMDRAVPQQLAGCGHLKCLKGLSCVSFSIIFTDTTPVEMHRKSQLVNFLGTTLQHNGFIYREI